jgi:hypothetical protein
MDKLKMHTENITGKNVDRIAALFPNCVTEADGTNATLIACFDKGVTTEAVTAIAKRKPLYAVFRDAGFDSDSTMVSLDQIFAAYSPTTERRVI